MADAIGNQNISNNTFGGQSTQGPQGSGEQTGLYRTAWWGKGFLLGAFYCNQPSSYRLSDLVLSNTNNYIKGSQLPLDQSPSFYPEIIGEPISNVKVVVRYGPGFATMGQVVPGFTEYRHPTQPAWYTGINGFVHFVGHNTAGDSATTASPGFYIARFSMLDDNGVEIDSVEKTFYHNPNSLSMDSHIIKACFNKAEDPVTPESTGPARWLIPLDQKEVVRNVVSKTMYGLWPNSVANLTRFYNCPISADSSSIITRISSEATCSACTPKLFDICYGDNDGSGSLDLGGMDYHSLSNAVYGQYRSLFMESAGSNDRIEVSGSSLDYLYAINIKQSLVRDSLDVGTFELNLAHLSGSLFVAGGGDLRNYTGSAVTLAGNNQVLRLIDSSRILDSPYFVGNSPIHYIISGSLEQGAYNASNPAIYGLLNPRSGVAILSGTMLDVNAGFGTVRNSDLDGDNPAKLYLAMSGAAQLADASGDYYGFKGRSYTYEYNILTYIRVKHNELNLSNNPTYRSGSLGDVISDFINHPKAYITSIGLYNDNKELVAIGKVSRPILRTGVDQSFFNVRLKQ